MAFTLWGTAREASGLPWRRGPTRRRQAALATEFWSMTGGRGHDNKVSGNRVVYHATDHTVVAYIPLCAACRNSTSSLSLVQLVVTLHYGCPPVLRRADVFTWACRRRFRLKITFLIFFFIPQAFELSAACSRTSRTQTREREYSGYSSISSKVRWKDWTKTAYKLRFF